MLTNKSIKYLFPVIPVLLFISCVIDTMPLGYSVRNCTNDTLIFYLSDKKELDDDIYWDKEIVEGLYLKPKDSTVVYVNGQKKYILDCDRVIPDSLSRASHYPIYKDTCYLYTINWDSLKEHSLTEIKNNNSYDRRVVTKKDFKNHIYNYKKLTLTR